MAKGIGFHLPSVTSKRTRLLMLTFAGVIFLYMVISPITNWLEGTLESQVLELIVGAIGTILVLGLGVKVL